MAIGNEFSDHVFEKRNYLNLAGSKLRQCSLGPELVVNPEFQSVHGRVRLERNGTGLWSKEIRTGEQEMCHSLRNIEHHHFKFEVHRRPGYIHVHYLGAGLLSFGDEIRLRDGDWMEIHFDGFGTPALQFRRGRCFLHAQSYKCTPSVLRQLRLNSICLLFSNAVFMVHGATSPHNLG
jgi:hypothetical protein